MFSEEAVFSLGGGGETRRWTRPREGEGRGGRALILPSVVQRLFIFWSPQQYKARQLAPNTGSTSPEATPN